MRVKYAGDESAQNFALSRPYPAPFSNKNAESAPSYQPGCRFNINAAIVLLRHLYSMVHYRQSDEITKEERSHPLLRLIWADFESASSVVAQSILRYKVVLDDPEGQVTLLELLETRHVEFALGETSLPTLSSECPREAPRGPLDGHRASGERCRGEPRGVGWRDGFGDHISSLFGRSAAMNM